MRRSREREREREREKVIIGLNSAVSIVRHLSPEFLRLLHQLLFTMNLISVLHSLADETLAGSE